MRTQPASQTKSASLVNQVGQPADQVAVGLLAHRIRPQAQDLARALAQRLESLGAQVRVPAEDAHLTGMAQWAVPEENFADGLTAAISVGGDGTMLRTVELSGAAPVLGVNVGHVGYLTAITPEELAAKGDKGLNHLLSDLMAGRFLIEERMTLEVSVSGSSVIYRALNDAVVEKSSAGNTVRLGVAFHGVPFTDYSADGLIVATPTGSTAYAFSARGPVVAPLMKALVVVPVAAHMLFDRSLVLDANEVVTVKVLEGRDAALFVDGRAAGHLAGGAVVTVRQHQLPAKFITFAPREFHQILRAKFGLNAAQPWKTPGR
jgi:NAD+ kinase